jgi:hypothetical protein
MKYLLAGKEEFPANNERETIKQGVRVSEGGWTVKHCKSRRKWN